MICFPDFDGQAFKQDDFETSSIKFSIHKFLFDRLPCYFKREDTYIDNTKRGILERYLSIFANEIDQEFVPYIECFINMVDASVTNEEYLPYIADTLGNPPDIFLNNPQYRNLLLNILGVYKIKGTKKSYDLLFGMLGYTATINDIPISGINNYDVGAIYDDIERYDKLNCIICHEYEVIISPIDINTPITSGNLNSLHEVIKLNEPINAKLTGFILMLIIEENINLTISEQSVNSVDSIYTYFMIEENINLTISESYDEQIHSTNPNLLIEENINLTISESTNNTIIP